MATPITNTGIANQALAKFSESRIDSIDQLRNVAAEIIRIHFDQVRKEVLAAARWPFAIARATLPELPQPDDWGHAYQLPDDYIRVVSINGFDPEFSADVSFVIEGNALLTNEPSCRLKYIADITDPNRFTVDFVAAFVQLLAARIAPAITGNNNDGTQLELVYLNMSLPKAVVQNENQNQVRRPWWDQNSPFLQSRYGGRS